MGASRFPGINFSFTTLIIASQNQGLAHLIFDNPLSLPVSKGLYCFTS
jgi:hypothetical protein